MFLNKRWFPGGSVCVRKRRCHQFHFLTFLYESHLSKAHKSADALLNNPYPLRTFSWTFLKPRINPCYDLIRAEKQQVRRSRSDGASGLKRERYNASGEWNPGVVSLWTSACRSRYVLFERKVSSMRRQAVFYPKSQIRFQLSGFFSLLCF